MNNKGLLLFGLMVCLALSAACSATPTEAPATVPPPTAVPATSTPLPAPTATVALPTVTAVVPATSAPTAPTSASASSGSLADALAKSQNVKSFRLQLDMSGKGDFMGTSGPTTPITQEIPLVGMIAEISGQDVHMTLKGLVAAFVVSDATRGLEAITVGGKSYLHGPVEMLGAMQDKWYELTSETSSVAKPPIQSSDMLNSFGKMDLSVLSKTGTDSLDNKKCDVYTGDKAAALKLIQSLGPTALPNQDDLNQIDSSEAKFWVCDDGYLHQIRLAVEGHDKTDTTKKAAITVLLHMYDLNADIKIAAPADAELLKPSPFLFTTPTPGK